MLGPRPGLSGPGLSFLFPSPPEGFGGCYTDRHTQIADSNLSWMCTQLHKPSPAFEALADEVHGSCTHILGHGGLHSPKLALADDVVKGG